jgi:hypothetical protein
MKILAKAGDDTIDLATLSDQELVQLASDAKSLYSDAINEMGRWETVRCEHCYRENVSYRGRPFIGWTTSSGRTLCTVCTMRHQDKYGSNLSGTPTSDPVDEIMALLD